MPTLFTAAFVSATLVISCGSPFRPSRSGHQADAGVVIIIGTISSKGGRCPSPSLVVTRTDVGQGEIVRVVTSRSTSISGSGGCSGLELGTQVEVEGTQDNDQVTASRIAMIAR